jgi:lipopolysaccharide transport system permease protein
MIFKRDKNKEISIVPVTVIEPKTGWQIINFKELKEYRDLFYFLVWRDIKVLYAQTVLGLIWAILQPCLEILIFAIIFGKVAKINTDGIPYILFSSVAIIPWTYMSKAITSASESLIVGQNMLGKIYFPRLIFPMTPVLAKLVDFAISMLIVVGIVIFYHVDITWNILLFPLFLALMVIIAGAVGLWLSAMAIRFRDVKFALSFVIRMLMYTSPIVYSASSIPDTYRTIYSFNPLVSVIEGFRACLLGTSFSWQFIWPGTLTAIVLFISGIFYFKRMERVFVDVI